MAPSGLGVPALAGWLNWGPDAVTAEPVVAAGSARPLRAGEPFGVLSWNLQFAGTRRHRFFYDGGDAVRVPAADVDDALRAMAALLAAEAPEVALLQEVDRRSARTGRRDQWRWLAERAGWPAWVTTPYHRSLYVPHPPRRPLGRMEMHLGIGAAFPLGSARRHPLPPLAEPPLRQAFNLHRAMLVAETPLGDGRTLALAVTHLSAFSRGDGTLPRQVAVIGAWMAARRAAGQPFVLGGDFNLLPPGDDPARLGPEAAEYADRPDPLAALIPAFRTVFPAERLLDPALCTYLPPGADRPDRVLDYLFVSDEVEVLDARVAPAPAWLSDHLPVVARLRVR